MRDKYGVFQDAGCYPGTDVPINKLDIKDAAILEEAEAAFAAASAESIELGTPPFDLAYLCDLHRALFGDVYEWAGHLRSVDIAKGTTRFCTASRIAAEANHLFARLNAIDLSRLGRRAQIAFIAELYGELNMVHPFREGNGRTQRLLFEHWLLHNGLAVFWANAGREDWIRACVAAVTCDYNPLEKVFEACTSSLA
jgi:cell filamentation protein